jgi:hypothetical protein
MEHLTRALVTRFKSTIQQRGDQRARRIFLGERLVTQEGDLPPGVKKEAVQAYDDAWSQLFPGEPLPKE